MASRASKSSDPAIFLMQEEAIMLIINDDQRLRECVLSMSELSKYCSKAFAAYPLIISDEKDEPTVYHAA
jgi:hypothetical protein